MWTLLLTLSVNTATACSGGRPPFLVVGAPWPAPRERLPEPAIEVGTRPALVVSYAVFGDPDVRIRRGSVRPAGRGRGDRGPAPTWTGARGTGASHSRAASTRKQAEIRAARVVDATSAPTEESFTAAWEHEPSGHPGDCRVGGWQLYVTRGPGFERDGPPMAYDVYVIEPGASSELFWGTLEGSPSAVVIGDTDSCTQPRQPPFAPEPCQPGALEGARCGTYSRFTNGVRLTTRGRPPRARLGVGMNTPG